MAPTLTSITGLLSLVMLLSGCPLDNNIPETETCRSPSFAEVTGIQILSRDGDAVLSDGAMADLVVGGQGISMSPFRIEVTGEALRGCMLLDIETQRLQGDTLNTWQRGVVMRSTEPGVRRSGIIWYEGGEALGQHGFKLIVRMGGATLERFLWSPMGPWGSPQVTPEVDAPLEVARGDEFQLAVGLDNIAPMEGLEVRISGDSSVIRAVEAQSLPDDCPTCIAVLRFEPATFRETLYLQALEPSPRTQLGASVFLGPDPTPPSPEVTHDLEVTP